MSLINDVLKDLDNRQSNEQPLRRTSGQQPASLHPVESPRKPVSAIASGAVLGGVLLVMLGFWSGLFETTEAHVPERGISTTMAGAESSGAAPAPIVSMPPEVAFQAEQGIAVIAAEVTRLSNGEQLELALTAAVAHQLRERSDTQLVILLPDTQLQARLPDVANSDLIQAIDIQQSDTGLLLQLALAGKTGAQTYLLSEPENIRLVVKLLGAISEAPSEAPIAGSEALREKQELEQSEQLAQPEQLAQLAQLKQPEQSEQSEQAPAAPVQPAFNKTARELSPSELDEQANVAALELARRGQVSKAIRDLRGFVSSAAVTRRASGTLATLLLSRGDLSGAEQVLIRARSQHADDPGLQKLHARALLEQGYFAQALAVLAQTSIKAMDAEHLALLASLQQRTGAHEGAIVSYDRLLIQHGTDATWLVGRAISLEALGQGADARATYRQALRISEIDATLKNYANERLRALN